MSPVEFKKRPCRPVEFKGQGPLDVLLNISMISAHYYDITIGMLVLHPPF